MVAGNPNPNPDQDSPQVTMDITQDPYQLLGQLGISAGGSPTSRLSINNIVGADLTRLDMPQMLEVLRSIYERKGNKMVYRPRSFRVSTQSGALTDIQASLFRHFQTGQDEINHLLDLLTPLIPDADEEDCDAIRALVRDDIQELVLEAGWPGGPRRLKIKEAFNKCSLHLEDLRGKFGLDEIEINTAEEAENWSRYVTIEELLNGLEAVYENLDIYLNRTGPESFGNQVMWFNRALKALLETSVRLQFQLRARFVGMEELATKLIKGSNITIAELLAWTAEVCDKGALISTRAGRSGFHSVARDLANLETVYQALQTSAGTNIDIPEVYKPQIQATITSIIGAIESARKMADGSQEPDYDFDPKKVWVKPAFEFIGQKVSISLHSPQFRKVRENDLQLRLALPQAAPLEPGAKLVGRPGDRNTFEFDEIDLANMKAGTYDLVISRESDKKELLTLAGAFDVIDLNNPAPKGQGKKS